MRLRTARLVFPFAVATLTSAAAQDFPSHEAGSFNVSANFQVQAPLEATAQTGDMAKAIAQVSQQPGDLANRECDVLSATFKAECHVAQLNIGANINERRFRKNINREFGDRQKAISANLSVTYMLTPTADAKPAPAK